MAKKAKWLENATDLELLEIIQGALETGESADITKAGKAVTELIDRAPAEGEVPTIPNLVDGAIAKLNQISETYGEELEAVGDDVEPEEEPEEETSDLDGMTLKELRNMAKEAGIKGFRKMAKDELISLLNEGDDEAPADDDDEPALEDMTLKELRALAKEEGINSKGMKKEDLIEALADDEDEAPADEDEAPADDEEVDYTEMSLKDLKAEAKERGIRVKKGMKRSEIVKALEADDEE